MIVILIRKLGMTFRFRSYLKLLTRQSDSFLTHRPPCEIGGVNMACSRLLAVRGLMSALDPGSRISGRYLMRADAKHVVHSPVASMKQT